MHVEFFVVVIVLAFLFDFTNGFHDAATSIATLVATEVLKPWQAVLWAAFFNFVALWCFKLSIANTVGTGLVRPEAISAYLLFATLISAIAWNIITARLGLPSSSSHALIGGLAGAALMQGGWSALEASGFAKVVAAIVLSPLIGLFACFVLSFISSRLIGRNTQRKHAKFFKALQLVASAMLSLTHGGNDAQKTMGIIAVLLYSSGHLGPHFYVPFWVMLSCYSVLALGTLTGGWRIVRTMGKGITHLTMLRGSCVASSAALVIFAATNLGVPVSTTHTVTGAIVGSGMAKRFWGVNWSLLKNIGLTWVLTMPATALISAGVMYFR